MPRRVIRALALVALAVVAPGHAGRAATLTGIMVYSADWEGMPTGYRPESGAIEAGQLWHTHPSGRWHGLGVLRGLPPESLQSPLLNAPDFTIRIPLTPGEYDFTLLGEPGPLTEDDAYDQWALNLFLDDVTDRPAISVVFPVRGYRYGMPPRPNEAPLTVALPVFPVSATGHGAAYDDGATRVVVNAVSFLPPHRFVDVDLVSSAAPASSGHGTSDWVGVLRLSVESAAPRPVGRPGIGWRGRGIGPETFGIVPADGVVVGGAGGFAVPEAAPADPPVTGRREAGWRAAAAGEVHTPTPETTASPDGTPTAGTATPGGGTPPADRRTTPTPDGTATPAAGTETPAAAATPTPARGVPAAVTPAATPGPTPPGPAPAAAAPTP